MIPNNLNSAVHLLNSTNNLFVYYKQTINYKEGLYTDSSYINQINLENNIFRINIPNSIDMINNIVVKPKNSKYIVVSNGIDISNTNNGIFNLNKYKNIQLIIYNIDNIDDFEISFDAYLLKTKLKSAL